MRGQEQRGRAWNDQLLSGTHARTRGDVVRFGQIGSAYLEAPGDGCQRLAPLHGVMAQRGQFRRIGLGHPEAYLLARAVGNLQLVVGGTHRRGPTTQFGIKVLHGCSRNAGPLGDSADVDRLRHAYGLVLGLLPGRNRHPVLCGILGDEDGGQNQGHVVTRLLRQESAAGAEFPEIVTPGSLHGPLHTAWPAVVRGKGKVPVTVKHPAQCLEVLGGCDGRLVGVRPFIDIPVVLQAVLERRAAHELPDAASLRFRERTWLERALNQRNVGQIERDPLGAKDFLNLRKIAGSTAETFLKVALQAAREELHVGQHSWIQRDFNVVSRRVLGNGLLRL